MIVAAVTPPPNQADVLVASAARSTPSLLESADVIICLDRLRGRGPVTTLRHYPGCLVAAAGLGGGAALVAARAARPARITLSGGPRDRAISALLGALFAYGWMTAGWPVAALDQTCLRVHGRATAASWRDVPYEGLVSVSFPAPGVLSAAKPSSHCRCLISATSGAPTSA